MKLLRNIRWGVQWGLIFAAAYVVWAVVLLAGSGTTTFEKNGTTFPAVVALYVLGGLICGAIVGALRPLTRWKAGAAIVGIAAATPLYIAVEIMLAGPHYLIAGPGGIAGTIFGWAFFAVLGGSLAGLVLREIFADPSAPS